MLQRLVEGWRPTGPEALPNKQTVSVFLEE